MTKRDVIHAVLAGKEPPDVPAEQYVQAVEEHHPNFVLRSALFTRTMLRMKDHSLALDEAGLRGQVKVMIGGAPITEDYARAIGADPYAPDAALAALGAKELISRL